MTTETTNTNESNVAGTVAPKKVYSIKQRAEHIYFKDGAESDVDVVSFFSECLCFAQRIDAVNTRGNAQLKADKAMSEHVWGEMHKALPTKLMMAVFSDHELNREKRDKEDLIVKEKQEREIAFRNGLNFKNNDEYSLADTNVLIGSLGILLGGLDAENQALAIPGLKAAITALRNEVSLEKIVAVKAALAEFATPAEKPDETGKKDNAEAK